VLFVLIVLVLALAEREWAPLQCCDGEDKEHALDTSMCLTKLREWMGGDGEKGRSSGARTGRGGRWVMDGEEGKELQRIGGGERDGRRTGKKGRSGADVELPDPVGQAAYDDLMKER
jgi:hypothetical protein